MLESTAHDDVWPTFQSRKFTGSDCCFGCTQVEVLSSSRCRQEGHEGNACQSHSSLRRCHGSGYYLKCAFRYHDPVDGLQILSCCDV